MGAAMMALSGPSQVGLEAACKVLEAALADLLPEPDRDHAAALADHGDEPGGLAADLHVLLTVDGHGGEGPHRVALAVDAGEGEDVGSVVSRDKGDDVVSGRLAFLGGALGSGLDLVVSGGRHRAGRDEAAIARFVLRGLARTRCGGGNGLDIAGNAARRLIG